MSEMIPAWVNGVLSPVEKLDVHRRGLRHKAVSVFIMHKGRMLVQQRAAGKYHTPLLWANTCCTHPHWLENSVDCAHRRITQELGITDCPLEFRDQIEYRADVGGGLIEHEVVDMFTAHCDAPPITNLNPHEVADVTWLTETDLDHMAATQPDRLTPWIKIYMRDFRGRFF
jgi:isopentenyl-diphosphate delta-isomerase